MKRPGTILIWLFLLGGQVVCAWADAPAGSGGAIVRVAGVDHPDVGMFSTRNPYKDWTWAYSDRNYLVNPEYPELLDGGLYYQLSFYTNYTYECLTAGNLYAITQVNAQRDYSAALQSLGFSRVPGIETFQLFANITNTLNVVGLFSKQVTAGETFTLPALTIVAGMSFAREPGSGEVLYNGIELPAEWPPVYDPALWLGSEALPVPYLDDPPELIPIDTGRQLFVDDFLVGNLSGLTREFHYPQKYEQNPVLKPETGLERSGYNGLSVAGPLSGGLWWSPEKQLFEFWYMAGWVSSSAYAVSRDGLVWERPDLPLFPGSNRVLPDGVSPVCGTVVRDGQAANPAEKFKIFFRGSVRSRARAFLSADGIDWGAPSEGGYCGDRSTMFYNPFRDVWVGSLRWTTTGFGGRCRSYWEGDDFLESMRWLPNEPVVWARTDRLDPPDPRIGNTPQLYNLDAVAYESILLGFYGVFHGPPNDVNAALGLPKNTGLNFAYSRDGFHWHRPDRAMAINSEQTNVWDRGYVQSLGNICTVRGDKLWFYYIGFAGDESLKLGDPNVTSSMQSGLYGNGATGVAFLRRDGFVSLNADTSGTVTTRPVTFSGKHLFVNADVPQGVLRAELLDPDGEPIEPFTLANCIPFTGDSTLEPIQWTDGGDLALLAGQTVRFRFHLENGKFYSFWVSRDGTGRSDGYVAGGGPGFTGDTDTVGKASLEAEEALQRLIRPKGQIWISF